MNSLTEQRREREKQQRRQDILAAARRLFWERGYAHTTMPEIARAAQLAPGTLYLYFPSKGALYAELLTEGYEMLIACLSAAAGGSTGPATGATPRERAEALTDAFFAFARDCPEYFDVIFFVLQREAGGTRGGELEPAQLERLQRQEDACKAIVARAIEGASLPVTASVQDAVEALWSMLVGVVFYFRGAGPERFEAVAREAKHLLLNAAFGPGR